MDNHQSVKENQRINNFQKCIRTLSFRLLLKNIRFFNKKPEERFPKWLMNEIDRKKIEKISWRKKDWGKKLQPSKTRHSNAINKFLI